MSEARNRRNIFRVRCLFGANILMWRVLRVCASVRVCACGASLKLYTRPDIWWLFAKALNPNRAGERPKAPTPRREDSRGQWFITTKAALGELGISFLLLQGCSSSPSKVCARICSALLFTGLIKRQESRGGGWRRAAHFVHVPGKAVNCT